VNSSLRAGAMFVFSGFVVGEITTSLTAVAVVFPLLTIGALLGCG